MNELDDILGFICTEAVELGGEVQVIQSPLPPIRYDLELIEEEDGTLKWTEGEHREIMEMEE